MLNVTKKSELVLGAMGNMLAWYSFALFMPFLHILSKSFFPTGDVNTTSIISFLAVSCGLFIRPIGAAIFGPIGDRIGRQKALSLSILLMAVPTFCIGLLPDFQQIGIMSPIILLILRIFQGISMGGEFTTAMVHLVELAPQNRRGFFGSFTDTGSQVGVLLAAGSLVMLYAFFSEAEIYSHAWRYPFFGAALLVPFAFINPHRQVVLKSKKKESIFAELLEYKKEVLCTIAITSFSALSFYTLLTFLPYYLVRDGILKLNEATKCGIIANISIIISAIGFGYLSDILNRKIFLILGTIGVAVVTYLTFLTGLKSADSWKILHAAFGFFIGMYFSSRSAFFSEAFPKNIRCTGISLSMSLAQAVVGGSAAVVMNYCTSVSTILSIVPITVMSTLCLLALTKIQDRTGKDLR